MAGVISDQRTGHNIPHTVSCRALGVSESWFYKWRSRKPTGRELRRQQLTEEIKEIFKESGGTYGSPKIFILLVRKGWHVSVNTVARLMAELGLVARVVKHRKGLTRQGKRPAAPDHVKRDFTAEEPDLVWVGDMTEIVTSEGKIYLATVIDLFSRRLLGYAMGAHHDADLVVAALNMAGTTRGGDVRGVIFHSDRGSEYLAAPFRDCLVALGIQQSACVSGPGDNAHMESFFHSFKAEMVRGATFATETELRRTLRHFFRYYNHTRLHSALGFQSPVDYEAKAA